MEGLNFTDILDLLDPTKVVNEVVVGLIIAVVGLIFSIIVGIVVAIIVFNYKWKKAEEKQERDKRREELKSLIHKHNQNLINTVIKHWYTIPPHDITPRMKPIDTVIKPWYEDNFVSEKEYFITEHLQTGFADIWKLRQECKTLIYNLFGEENAIKGYIKGKLKEGIPPNFEQDFPIINTEVLIGDFPLDNVESLIYVTVEKFSKKGRLPDNYKLNHKDFESFGIDIDTNKTDLVKVKKMEVFKGLIETIIKDKTLYEKFEIANKTRKLSHKKIDEFYQRLKLIEHDFEEWDIPLKGTCKDCEYWHDKLKILE